MINNVLIKGLSGSIDNMTFRQRSGETIVSRRRRAASVPATEIQMQNQEQFRKATVFFLHTGVELID
ncbi:hypothetical protein GO495_22180 [Chitinophaga oryziterrae]|uniref:Uncharacterized protein n=1 Tax=Chitinophaga oryziterrae TaxID=1031224 RepID=A0A6N8JDL9_9BACT|nr:hypothetical protein [Chitinophaga oryziterrae]MVT43323.1 hypothetical protein [Chitinophaga oryziterrae]